MDRNKQCKVSTTSASITVAWSERCAQEFAAPEIIVNYEIKFREVCTEKFKIFSVPNDKHEIEISKLKSNTSYEVNVYWCNSEGDGKNLFRKQCTTEKSRESLLMENADVDKKHKPYLYHLKPVKEDIHYVDQKQNHSTDNNIVVDKIRVLDMIEEHNPNIYQTEEKNILLLGATGTGKSTLIDALFNFIAEVSYSNDHRYGIICKTLEEKGRSADECQSQTSTVTVYRIPRMEGLKVTCGVNIIDTPGFNDTREEFDDRITNQIKVLFEEKIHHIDAILIVVQLSAIRLTIGQKHVFSSISEMFGNDIKENIFVATTFDDSGDTKCVLPLDQVGLSYKGVFRFNNGTLFSKFSSDKEQEGMNQTYWNRRTKNFSELFDKLSNTPKIALTASVDVLRARQQLEIRLKSLEEALSKQAQGIANYKEDKTFIDEIGEKNADYKATGRYVRLEPEMQIQFSRMKSMTCPKCKKTCHIDCWVQHDIFRRTCAAMTLSKCTVCDGKCDANEHVVGNMIFELQFVEKMLSCEDIVNRQNERDISFGLLQKTLNQIKVAIDEINTKALKKHEFTLADYIQDIIRKEEKEEKEGYKMRIQIQRKILEHLNQEEIIWKLSMDHLMSS